MPMPLSSAQERCWFLEQLEPGTPVYNTAWAFRLVGDLDEAAIRKSFDALLARHAVLRTTYGVIDGVPHQIVHEPHPVSIEFVGLAGSPVEAPNDECQALLLRAARVPFDLARGPILRPVLVRMSPQEHFLLVAIHHIASDGWSSRIMAHELSQLYNARVRDDEPELPDFSIQYVDHVLRQQQKLQGGRLAEGMEFWTRELDGLPPTLNLPADCVRGALPEYRAASVPVELSPGLTARLKRLAIEEKSTPFMVLLAGWMFVLSRYAGEEDIAIGTPVAGRCDSDAEKIVGLFVNTLVLRADLSGNPTFRQALQRVRETCLKAYEWQDVPFEKLVAALHPERQNSQSPLFQVMFAFDGTPEVNLSLDSILSEPVSIDCGLTKFDLRLHLAERPGALTGALEYRTCLFDRWRIAQMSRHFLTLLEEVVDRPDGALREACLFGREEARTLDRMQTGPHLPIPALCLHQAFEEQASRTPAAPAVWSGDRCVSYRELDDRAHRLSAMLRRRGVKSGDRVGLCVDPTVDAVVGVLGILKAGAAYVPFDPEHPVKRLSLMIHDGDVRALVTHRRCVEALLNQGKPVLDLEDEEDVAGAWRSGCDGHGTPGDLAYVLYTSGSTGEPKGVAVEHRSVMNYVASLRERLSLPAGASFGWVQPLSVDSSITTLFGALLTGGCIHVIPRERVIDPDYLEEYGRGHPIDVLKIAPTHLAALLQAAADPAAILPRRYLILGGEPLPWRLVEQIARLSPNLRLFNHYGPTEATVGVTVFPIDVEHADRRRLTVPIGRPLHNVKTYVLDDHLQVCPFGVPGELWIGGDCLARGYLNQEELTRSRFASHSFAGRPAERVYRSGDRVVLNPDGNLRFLARKDNQVKIRGFRVEPGEAQSVLLAQPDVAEATVVPRRDPEGDVRLVAYVVPRGGCTLNVDDLRDLLALHLPSVAIPTDFVLLDGLPRTAHGKLDVGALPDPKEMSPTSRMGLTPPVGELEIRLAGILETLLGRRPIGRHDSFFDLGGHSLLAVRFTNRIEEALKIRVPIQLLFDHPTIAEIARFVESATAGPGVP